MLASKGLYVVTGANTGIGKVIALELASRGAHVVLACRSKERAEEARLEIVHKSGSTTVHHAQLDLQSMQSVTDFAESLKGETIAALVNNAGVMHGAHTLTPDGFESTWAVNALGPWLLTELLLPALRRSDHPRVVNVGSRLERTGDLSDLEKEQDVLAVRTRGCHLVSATRWQRGSPPRDGSPILHFSLSSAMTRCTRRRAPAL